MMIDQQISNAQISEQSSLMDAIVSGLVRANDNADERFTPQLISNQRGSTMGDAIREELHASDAFDMSVAFVNENALKSLYQSFLDQHESQSEQQPSRIITSTKNYFNSPKAFKELMKLQRDTGVEVLIWENPASHEENGNADQPFHPKGYLFARRMTNGKPYYNLYVGSSNLTNSALQTQREWNLRVSSTNESDLIAQVRRELDSQMHDSVPLTDEWIRQYEEEFEKYAPPRKELIEQVERQAIVPNAMQSEALESLAQLREQGATKAIVISATGTGKTYLSAFDVKACNPRRMLYVANRVQILKSAMKSYQRVLGCSEEEIGLLSGGSKQSDRKYVFATVDTLCHDNARILEQFDPNDFDYILIDEVHHAGAKSYRRIIDYFDSARFMLGMTATPERTDGINIFELFDYNVAYEIRLQQALDANMLCPFHYYGVAEYFGDDESQRLDVRNGLKRGDSQQLQYELEQLTTPDRVRYIIRKLEQYGSYDQQITGLVFCSRREEARRLSELFNSEMNQQAERPYRTRVVTGETPQKERDKAIEDLESGELDYLFTVDLFNEGVDIPAINQIVMLRSTQSSIVFTQQLGRGLRKFPHKSCVTVIDFIGNYANNYLIPVALYGNVGDRDTARRNLQRESIGLSSISFDKVSRERVLKSLDTANWSDMKRLADQYMQMRYELGRIPMLSDVHMHDPSLVLTMAMKKDNYLEFVRSQEARLGKGQFEDQDSLLETLAPVNETQNALLKFADEILLPGLRPQELVILDELASFSRKYSPTVRSVGELEAAIASRFPQAYRTYTQFESALRVLDFSYFDNREAERFGGTPLIEIDEQGMVSLSARFRTLLDENSTFTRFFADCVSTGLTMCHDVLTESATSGHSLDDDHGFVYEHKYRLFEVERLLGWPKHVNGSSVGGYLCEQTSGTMPIFVKYANSQYEDQFMNPQELHWYSKNKRTPDSPEFKWLAKDADADWSDAHFVPLFVMRKEEANEGRYYYVGHVASFTEFKQETRPDADGKPVNIVSMDLRLAHPIDGDLYRHLTGERVL